MMVVTMVLREITELSTEKEYEIISQHYQELKQHIKDCIEFEDFEILSTVDITCIKELHAQKSILFWKLKVEKTQNKIKEISKIDDRSIECCELKIRYYEYMKELKKAECKAKGDDFSYNRYHKPVLENKVMQWQLRLENSKKLRKMETSHEKKVEVIP